MDIKYISLGSFCHPKIFLRNTNRQILKSLPFDFHSSPNTYSIYNILNKLHKDKTFKHEFDEIIFEHSYNSDKKEELAVSDKEKIFFLHFFDKNDKISDNNNYPISVQDNLNEEKIIKVQNKFKERYEYLYKTMNNENNNDILIFLRIENYSNKSWKIDVQNLVNSIKKFDHPNKFLIYTQIEIDQNLDFNYSKKINYDFGFPIIFYKYLFDEKITTDNEQKKNFNKILSSFENLIQNCISIHINKITNLYYYDETNNLLFKLNNINCSYAIKFFDNKKLEVYQKDKVIIFFKNNENIYYSIS